MQPEYLFTSESVTEGHPDKLCDQISDGIVDAALAGDPDSRVACEVLVNTNLVVVSGEIRTEADIDFETIVRRTIRAVGYDGFDPDFGADSVEVMVRVDQQSDNIAQGVDNAAESREDGSTDELDKAGAGDQGMMFGYATDETENMMPLPIAMAHALAERMTAKRKDGTMPYLRPDGKTQVTVRYMDDKPVEVVKVLISTQHDDDVSRDVIREGLWRHVVEAVLPLDMYDADMLNSAENFLVNPTGKFVIGGPVGDCGLTGRKIIVDTYGGMARHGGGAFSGKDPSKVDRSAAYAVRHVAKNVVAAGLAVRCEVQVAYAIGTAQPVSVMVETFGTETVAKTMIEELIAEHFDLRPAAFRSDLELHRPIYSQTAAYGHFGRTGPGFTWERTDKAEALRAAAAERAAAVVA